MKYVIGIDLGGTNIRGASISLEGRILQREKTLTEVPKGRDYVVNKLSDLIHSLTQRMDGQLPDAIGIGVPGIVHYESGIIEKSPNFPDWIRFNLKEELKKKSHRNVVIENDANAAALGEGWSGAGRGEKSFCMLTLGTGIGGGIVLNGNMWRGSVGMAGELGHINIYPEGRPCGCGNRGCMEQYASASGIVKEAVSGIDSTAAKSLKRAMTEEKKSELTAAYIFSKAQEGDEYAKGVLGKAGEALGIGITDLVNILNVELFIIGGGAADAWDQFIGPLKNEIKERAYSYTGERVQIKKAVLGDDAGLMGAASLAIANEAETKPS